jgi:hypothetical protein
MNTFDVQIIESTQDQYILYGLNYSKLMDSMPGKNTMITIYFPSLELAQNVYLTLQYFMHNWYRGYHGGEMGSGIRRCDPQYIGVIPEKAIGKKIFTKINNETMMNSNGYTINISSFVNRSEELKKYPFNLQKLPKGKYDEFTLAVLRITSFLPRIKREKFTLNPFKYDFIETDENTVRKMRLVI